jgi:2-polyprenyl-3-methyl-5-hydroxy-6-metoxy-1,4-benzoquinol methylase
MTASRSAVSEHRGAHGADIASQWIDELDLEAIRFVASPSIPKRVALDLGCGLGMQGIRFATLGCSALLYDIVDIGERIEQVKHLLALDSKLEFRCLDLRGASAQDFPAQIGVAYSQRFIHHLRFEEASALLAMLAPRLCAGARLFISASGLGSELAVGYAHAARPIEERFAPLAAPMQSKHAIQGPVCLYATADLERLVHAHGLHAIRVWSSPFGNAKGVFERR